MFIPRDPVNENMFCQYKATTSSGGTGDFIAYAGAVVHIKTGSPDTYVETSEATADKHFGFLEQTIKTGYHAIHPAGYILDKDFGMSHVVAKPTFAAGTRTVNGTQATPVAVAHLGIWETTHYDDGAVNAGAAMYVKASTGGKICDSDNDTQVAWCVKGVTAGQAAKNVAGTTLYPLRIKLLI